jgi:hypothetical protein
LSKVNDTLIEKLDKLLTKHVPDSELVDSSEKLEQST